MPLYDAFLCVMSMVAVFAFVGMVKDFVECWRFEDGL